MIYFSLLPWLHEILLPSGLRQQEQQQPGQKPEDLSKQEAEKLLKIIEQEEQKVQEKLRRKQSSPNKSSKDW